MLAEKMMMIATAEVTMPAIMGVVRAGGECSPSAGGAAVGDVMFELLRG